MYTMHFSYATIRSQCIFFASLFVFLAGMCVHLVCCTGSIKYLIFILFFFFCSQKYHAHSFILFFSAKGMFANQQHSTGELLQTLLQTFIVFFLICFWVSLSFSTIHTQNKTGGKTVEWWKTPSVPAVSLSPNLALFTNCLIFKLHTQRLVAFIFHSKHPSGGCAHAACARQQNGKWKNVHQIGNFRMFVFFCIPRKVYSNFHLPSGGTLE
uniref:(northern house mosquito) hypothetical protein n=1 Tax=Culex pipiens TaxID=7175 RepID=A0A8D8ESX8_CULPI